MRLLVAASGTGGHLFPAIAIAEQLPDYQIEWLGVPDRMEAKLVDDRYPLHTIRVGGFQGKPGLGTLKTLWRLLGAIWQVRQILQQGRFNGVLTTGGYIAGPAILAARSLGLPIILHESNALPGKVTRWFARWCTAVAIGFEAAAPYLKQGRTVVTGTPVRAQFRSASAETLEDLPIPPDVPLVAIVGGSQGAVSLNQKIRQAAPAWLEAGAWIVHQTGENDPDVKQLQHPHYLALPFYQNMAALFRRADLVISRAGAGTLTELAMTHTPSILIPYPYAAEDHQTYNAKVFVQAGAAQLFQQADLTPDQLQITVSELLASRHDPQGMLQQMATNAAKLSVPDSAEQVAMVLRQILQRSQSSQPHPTNR
jgi:UDP-N-acetylglucosamine--N-acetylmuramyl-(pentapeptide) pyrophosphoryl-undecaprenol N-acetylglucosamine transferase